MLKNCDESILKPLRDIFQILHRKKVNFLVNGKKANVVPVHKKGVTEASRN